LVRRYIYSDLLRKKVEVGKVDTKVLHVYTVRRSKLMSVNVVSK